MRAELHFKKILSRFIRLINETLKWLPFNLVMAPVIFFYFAPDSVITDVIYDWQQLDVSEKNVFCPAISESCICECFCCCVFKIFML